MDPAVHKPAFRLTQPHPLAPLFHRQQSLADTLRLFQGPINCKQVSNEPNASFAFDGDSAWFSAKTIPLHFYQVTARMFVVPAPACTNITLVIFNSQFDTCEHHSCNPPRGSLADMILNRRNNGPSDPFGPGCYFSEGHFA